MSTLHQFEVPPSIRIRRLETQVQALETENSKLLADFEELEQANDYLHNRMHELEVQWETMDYEINDVLKPALMASNEIVKQQNEEIETLRKSDKLAVSIANKYAKCKKELEKAEKKIARLVARNNQLVAALRM